MAGYTKNRLTTTDNYGAWGTNGLYGLPPCERINVVIEGNPIFIQFARGMAGSWEPEAVLRPGVNNRTEQPFTAVRVRSYNPGFPATVSLEAKVE